METRNEHVDVQKSVLILLQELECISRQLCEGYAIDLGHAEKVIDSLASFSDRCRLRNNPAGVVSSLEASGVDRKSGAGTASMAPPCSHRLKWVRQMREALARIKSDNEELDHRVSFVIAAIECMNLLCAFLSFLPRYSAGHHRSKALRTLAVSQRVCCAGMEQFA